MTCIHCLNGVYYTDHKLNLALAYKCYRIVENKSTMLLHPIKLQCIDYLDNVIC